VLNKGRTVAEGSVLELTRDLDGGSSYKAEFSAGYGRGQRSAGGPWNIIDLNQVIKQQQEKMQQLRKEVEKKE
jgi:hypothetical protein